MGASDLPPALQASHVLRRRGPVSLLLRRGWEDALPVDALLGGAPLAAWGAAVPHALSGRGPVHVVATPRGELVVKELRRGGLLGGVARRTFLDARRGWREAQAAEALLSRGIATPPVIVARTVRLAPGLFRLEIATLRVASRGDLLELLRTPQRDARELRALARAVGATLRRAHDAGLRHRDLNAKNLLVPAGAADGAPGGAAAELVILDLDRCAVGAPLSRDERLAALARLARSLVKRGVLPLGADRRSAEASRRHAEALRACRETVRAYGALPGLAPGALLRDIVAELRRTLSRHALGWSQDDAVR